MSKIKCTCVCKICGKDLYDDSDVCVDCKTNEFISYWGDPFFDEEAISLDVVGEYPYHYKYWEEYKEKLIGGKGFMIKCSDCKYWKMGVPCGRCVYPGITYLPTNDKMVFEDASEDCPLVKLKVENKIAQPKGK